VVSTPSAGARSVAVYDQLRAVDKGRLSDHRGSLSLEDLRAVEEAIRRILVL
jgi:mRNA-degrading endonuclease toxin of MazEF toxin-antitoxin module